jgi:hypothetical protein
MFVQIDQRFEHFNSNFRGKHREKQFAPKNRENQRNYKFTELESDRKKKGRVSLGFIQQRKQHVEF